MNLLVNVYTRQRLMKESLVFGSIPLRVTIIVMFPKFLLPKFPLPNMLTLCIFLDLKLLMVDPKHILGVRCSRCSWCT